LISYPAGSLSDRWGRRNLLLASFVICLIAYLGFALTLNVLLIAGLFKSRRGPACGTPGLSQNHFL
jgi:MFS family permease